MLTINFDLSAFESVEIIPVADCHIGNELFSEADFKKTIDYILEEPDDERCARICLLNGDLTESVTRNSRVGDVFDQTMTPSVQVATMVKYLRPLMETNKKYPQGKILSYCAGNHDEGRYKDTGISAAESIAVGLGLEDRFSKDGCYSFIRVQSKNRQAPTIATIYNTHLSGGGTTIGGKANRVLKAGLHGGIIADVIVGSHVHEPMTFKEDVIVPQVKDCILKQKTITYVITNAFLRYGGYSQRGGMKPGTIAVPRIFLMTGRDQSKADNRKQNKRYIYTEVIL